MATSDMVAPHNTEEAMDVDPHSFHRSLPVPAALATRVLHYSLGPPSPPHISIPHVATQKERVLPAYAGIDGEDISEPDLKIITQVHHVAIENVQDWKYINRREAQLILPFLYLGPSIAAKDRSFIQNEKITMLLAIRDTKSAQAALLSGEKVARELGIEWGSIDTAGTQELIASFPATIKTINDHLLAVYRKQTIQHPNANVGDVTIDSSTFHRGKVLVFCESGNERSACAVTAYLIAMFGFDLKGAVTFVQAQRFCIALDDSMTRILESFCDIISARRMVAAAKVGNDTGAVFLNNQSLYEATRINHNKRSIEAIMDADNASLDMERFTERVAAKPFMDEETR